MEGDSEVRVMTSTNRERERERERLVVNFVVAVEGKRRYDNYKFIMDK